jgi:hypothetical protein
MPRLTLLVMGVLVVLLAGCAAPAIDRPTAAASGVATSSPSHEPDSPAPSATQAPTGAPDSPSPSPSQASTATPDSLPSAPTGVTARSEGPGKPGTMFQVHLTWTQAAPTDAYRIYKYETGEGPGYGKCVFDKAMAGLLLETRLGATSADISLDSAVSGAGVRCLYVVALNAGGESSPMLAWRSS